jgi:hypothetical protein
MLHLGPDPFNQRAVFDEIDFLHVLTKSVELICYCAFGSTSTEVHQQNPTPLPPSAARCSPQPPYVFSQKPGVDRQGDLSKPT